jgi:two-component system, OmpR family, response regulator ArlR
VAKILVVEDDPEVKKSLATWLEMEHHLVEMTEFGADALQLLQNFQYELIILDWGLPDMTGPEVLKRFRSAGGQTPVIFLTGKNDLQSITTGLDCGADDYLTKPFDMPELSARIRSRLRRRGGLQSFKISVGNITLDSETRHVSLDGESVHLTNKEFTVLEFLMRNPNRLFGARALRDALWPSDSETSEDSVRVCIKKLRRKISDQNDECIVKTVLGSGYTVETTDSGETNG